MNERQRRLEGRVVQVGVVGAELGREEHSLVDQRAARHRDDVEIVLQAGIRLENACRNYLAGDVELALELVLIGHIRTAADEGLAVKGLGNRNFRRRGQAGVVDRHITPADKRKALVGDHLGNDLFHGAALVGVPRHEDVADGIVTRLGQGEAQSLRLAGEELVRDLHQHAGAVAHFRVRAGRAAMFEIDQNPQPVLDGAVGLLVVQVHDEADAACIALV